MAAEDLMNAIDGAVITFAYPHFDLYDFAVRVEAAGIDSAITAAAGTLKTAVDDAVIASWAGSAYDTAAYGSSSDGPHVGGTHGLGFFFPAGSYQEGDYPADYDYQEFYSGADLVDAYGSVDNGYGKLDFLTADGDTTVESWHELLEYWFDPDNELTVAEY